MQLREMDKELVDIYNIRNLESVSVKDLVVTTNSRLMIIPSIIITYDGGKYLNFCALDKYFKEYVRKIAEVYNDEKNNILEDSLLDPFRLKSSISIDEKSRQILESGTLEELDKFYTFYDNKIGYEGSLMFQIDEVKLLIPIVKYHVKQLLNLTDKVVTFNTSFSGYRDRFVLEGKVDGIMKDIPLTFEKISNNSYRFNVGGLTDRTDAITIDINFSSVKIEVKMVAESYNLSGTWEYRITNGIVKQICDVTRNGLTIHYKNTDLEIVDNEVKNLGTFDEDNDLVWYQLPWRGFYGFSNHITDLSPDEKVVKTHSMYLGLAGRDFIRKEFYSKNYTRRKSQELVVNQMSLAGMEKTIIGILVDRNKGIYVIESAFGEASSNNYYKGRLANKYFYHAIQSLNGLVGITRENMITLDYDKDILINSDLLNKENLLMLVVGE